MDTLKMSCPSCGELISVPQDINQLNCVQCGVPLVVQRGEGYAALKLVEQPGEAVKTEKRDIVSSKEIKQPKSERIKPRITTAVSIVVPNGNKRFCCIIA